MSTRRIEAFSDGIFAFAATLLVLGLHDPGSAGGLGHGLIHQWPFFAAYAVSFVTIGIIWLNHHSLFACLRELDRLLVFLNLLLLMVVAFLPFPTGLLATYVRSGGSDSHVAGGLYGLTMTALGLLFTVIWWRLTKSEHLLAEGSTPADARASLHRTFRGPIIYLVATAISLVSAPAALIGYAAVAVYFAFPGRTLSPSGEE
ncbi:MAG: TMEM175 family protein [Chloroflexota bacterium]